MRHCICLDPRRTGLDQSDSSVAAVGDRGVMDASHQSVDINAGLAVVESTKAIVNQRTIAQFA